MKLMKAVPRPAGIPREFDRFFDRFFGPRGQLSELPVTETEWAPALDLAERDTEFVIRLEVPGVHKENLDINLEGNVVTISGKREFRKEHETEDFIWREREEGRFVRSVRLPKAVVSDKVAAVYHDGLLTVRLPKAEPALQSRIAIE